MAWAQNKRKQANYFLLSQSFPRSAWECSPGRSASHQKPNAERPLRHSHAERGNDQTLKCKKPRHQDRAFQFRQLFRTQRPGYAGSRHRYR